MIHSRSLEPGMLYCFNFSVLSKMTLKFKENPMLAMTINSPRDGPSFSPFVSRLTAPGKKLPLKPSLIYPA
jgi:hypothetical protein